MSEKTNIEHFLRLHDQQLHANPCKAPKFSLNVDHDQQHIQVFADIWNRVRLLTQGPVVCLSWQIRKRNVKHLYLGGRQRYPDLEQGVYELGSWREKGGTVTCKASWQRQRQRQSTLLAGSRGQRQSTCLPAFHPK